MAQFTGSAIPGALSSAGVLDGPATPIVLMTSGTIYDGPATPIQLVTGRPTLPGPATPVQFVTGRTVLSGKGIPVVISGSDPTTTWNWDFRIGVMPPGSTFSRGTAGISGGAMVTDVNGLIKWAPENLITNSNSFTGADWAKTSSGSGSVPTVTASFAPGPDGVVGAATRLQCAVGAPGSGDDQSMLVQNLAITGQREFKMWMKLNAGTSQTVLMRVATNSSTVTVTNVWQQFTVTDTTLNNNGNGVNFGLRSGSTGNNNTLDLLVAYVQCYRVPNVSTAYVATGANPFFGPRFAYDPMTHVPLGYLAEMQSTNRWAFSQSLNNVNLSRVTVTLAAGTAPDGTTTANRLFETAVTGDHSAFATFNLPANTTRGFSIFAKAGTRSAVSVYYGGQTAGVYAGVVFDLANGVVSQTFTGPTSGTIISSTITPFGGGWYRCSIQAQVSDSTTFGVNIQMVPAASGNTIGTSGTISYAGDITKYVDLWGVQLDTDGVGITSPIPTAGVTVTRTADVDSIPLANIGFDGTQGGVVMATYRLNTLVPASPGFNQGLIWINNNGSVNESVAIAGNFGGSGVPSGFVISGGTQRVAGSGTAAISTRRKQATVWDVNRVGTSIDGGAVVTNSLTITLPVAVNTFGIGTYSSHATNGPIESVAYYKGARTDAFVQQITAP